LYVADQGNKLIRKISPAGVVSTLAGVLGTAGYLDGTSATALFGDPYGVAVDASGHVYVADSSNNRIRKITPSGVVSTYSGVGVLGALNGTAWLATFSGPYGVCLDAAGNLYVADSNHHQIRRVSPDGTVSTLAGVVVAGGRVANTAGYMDGTSGSAKFNAPTGVAVDASGHVYVADYNNHRIRKLSPY
jgi:sugar lactone lactonase YvrE